MYLLLAAALPSVNKVSNTHTPWAKMKKSKLGTHGYQYVQNNVQAAEQIRHSDLDQLPQLSAVKLFAQRVFSSSCDAKRLVGCNSAFVRLNARSLISKALADAQVHVT